MRILIELPTWLGDAVMASAAIEAIAKHAAFGAGNLTGKFDYLTSPGCSFKLLNFTALENEIKFSAWLD